MKILDLKNDKVVISPEALGLTFFSDLWQRDKTSTKSKAYKDIAYIYYMCDFNSPYSQYPEVTRESLIKEFAVGKEYKVDDKVTTAMQHYRELNTTPGMRQLDAAYIALYRSEEYLKGVDYTKMDANGRFVYDPEKVQKMITGMPKLMQALNEAKEICMKEKTSTDRVRGGATLGQFED